MALDAMIAIAVLVLCTLPIRRSNLISMEMDRRLRLPVRKGEPGSFTFAAWEVKNRRGLATALPPWKVDLIALYLRHYRPLLADAGNPYLFPAASGPGHRAITQFAKLVCDRIGKHAGVTINLHLFRHLMASIILQDNPQADPMVEQLLGHAPGSRSTHCYAELASRQAAARLDQTLTDAEEKQQALRRFKLRRRNRVLAQYAKHRKPILCACGKCFGHAAATLLGADATSWRGSRTALRSSAPSDPRRSTRCGAFAWVADNRSGRRRYGWG